MTENKHKKKNDDQGQNQDILKEKSKEEKKSKMSELDVMREEVKTLKSQLQEYLDKIKRLGADFDNYKKRQTEESGRSRNFGKVDAVKHFIPLVDSIQSAMSAKDENRPVLMPIWDQMNDILESIGVKKIEPKRGDDFDPSMHESLFAEETNDLPEEKVLEIFQAGFSIESYVLRPARVKISKKPEEKNADNQKNSAK